MFLLVFWNIIYFDLAALLALGKSLIYRITSNGPKIDPWGTPVITGNVVDLVSSICIYCSRFSR